MHGHDVGKYFKDFNNKQHVPSQYRASKNVDKPFTLDDLRHLFFILVSISCKNNRG